MEYTLFNEDGSKLEAGLPFMFTYTDSNNGKSQGYVSGWGTWLENGEEDGNRPAQITKGDAQYNICYDDDDTDSNSCVTSGNGDDVKVYLTPVAAASAIVFASPMYFSNVSAIDGTTGLAATPDVAFSGTLYVNPYSVMCSNGTGGWKTSGCNVQSDERPKYTFADGTQLTSTISGVTTTYRMKAARILKDFGVKSDVNECSALNVASAPAQITDATALANIEATGLVWDDKPKATDLTDENTLKYIDGVEQDK
jgi:hypothetical protein